MYRKQLTILQRKSVYRYKLDTDEFISATASEIERQLAKKNDFIQFKITKADVDFSESRKMQMGNAQSQVEDSTNHTITYEEKPLFELINMIMMHTMLTRLAIIRIINKLSDKARNKINNQDYLEEAIAIINKQLVVFRNCKDYFYGEIIMIDKNAPIIPYQEMGGVKLYSSLDELSNILCKYEKVVLNDTWIRYDISNIMSMFFHRGNNKLFKMTTMKEYNGRLFDKITVETTEKELIEIDDSFVYDEFEEVWESKKGIFIETDPQTHKATWISVYIMELDDNNFEEAKW